MSKTIVITGASSGIGAELARQLAARGETLMLAARRARELNTVARACGRDTYAFTTDVTRRQDVNRLRDEALRTFGQVDVWINNAGRGIARNVLELTDEDIDEMMTVNLKSALYGAQAILPHFKERGQGHLINVSTMLSRIPFASIRSAYSASKAALNSLTSSLRMELRSQFPGIHVSLVLPGIVLTDFAANSLHAPEVQQAYTMPGQSVEQAVAAIVKLIDNPQAEAYTNPEVQHAQILQYYGDVEAFEQRLVRR